MHHNMLQDFYLLSLAVKSNVYMSGVMLYTIFLLQLSYNIDVAVLTNLSIFFFFLTKIDLGVGWVNHLRIVE
jgi:hypothetical protein